MSFSTRILAAALTLAAATPLVGGLVAAPALAAAPSPGEVAVAAGPPSGDFAELTSAAATRGSVSVAVNLKRPARTVSVAAEIALYAREEAALRLHLGLPTAAGGGGVPVVGLTLTPAQVGRLASADTAARAGRNHVGKVDGTSSVGSDAGQQLPSRWDYTQINAAWSNTHGWTGNGSYVVIIDTGVDRTNPYLTGKVVNEACFARYGDGTGACNNGATYQYGTGAAGVTGSAAPCTYSYGCAHGTFVAHQAAGAYGVAQGAKIIAIRAAHAERDASGAWTPLFNDADFQNALWYVDRVLPAAGIVAAAVNYSVGGGSYSGYCDATFTATKSWVDALRNDWQIPVVVSSGNSNYSSTMAQPACISSVVSVGNSTLTATNGGVDAVYGNVSNGSNSNATLDLLAPGTDICSAVPKTLDNDGTADGWMCGWNGTSMAAPQVTGALAVLTQKRPTATVDQYVARLQVSGSTGGVLVTDSRNNVTRTRINVANAVYYF